MDKDGAIDNDVILCKLVDGKISVRLDDSEIFILPDKNDCEMSDIELAMNILLDKIREDQAVDVVEW